MATSARASRALQFMQQCRQNASLKSSPRSFYQSQIRKQSTTSTPPLEPESFGKKLHLEQDPNDPLPEWRLAKTELPVATSQPEPAAPSSSSSSSPSPSPSTNRQAAPPLDLNESNPYNFPRSRHAPIPRYKHNPAVPAGFLSFLKYRLLRLPEPPNPHLSTRPTFTVLTNPYRARKAWPPILSHMSETEQFHYEKKFRRRLMNKTLNMRSTWDRWALFLRRFGVGFLIFYFAFVAEPADPDMRVPPDGLRYWVYGKLRGLESVWGQRMGHWVEGKYAYYRLKHKRQWDPYNHDGWDETRPRNSLPGKVAPNVNAPLGDLSIADETV